MRWGKALSRGILSVILGFSLAAFDWPGSGGVEIQITRAERDSDTCYLYGIVANNTDNHLDVLEVDHNLLAQDMAANSQLNEQEVLSLSVQPTGKCTVLMAALFAGVRMSPDLPPFISKCKMEGVNEGACQRLVKFKPTLSKDAWGAIGGADWQAMKRYEAQKQKAVKDAAAELQRAKAAAAATAAASAQKKQEALAKQQAAQAAEDAYEKSVEPITVRYSPGVTQDEIANRLTILLRQKAPDFQIDPSLYSDVIQEASRRVALCSAFTRADYEASKAPQGGHDWKNYLDGKFIDCLGFSKKMTTSDGRGLFIQSNFAYNFEKSGSNSDFQFEICFMVKEDDPQARGSFDNDFASYRIMRIVVPISE